MAYTRLQQDQVRVLRRQGKSLNEIVKSSGVPKSTLRGWIKDLALTSEQKKKLELHSFLSLQKGRKLSQKNFLTKRKEKELTLLSIGKKEIGSALTSRELFIAGIALYWAEGFKNKYEKRLGFCNSDAQMIKFYLFWLEKSLGIKKDQITARLTINIAHSDREAEILSYWRDVTFLPLSSFTKTFYQRSKSKKKYKNRNEYYGVLRLHVKESLDDLLKMRGWIAGLGSLA